ncbi:Mce family protein MceE [Nocardia nova SH22a]|uniref:Mce family protein MceE n=1 Tax=Nocardia nova SH22a TaxID=1415166 RepID=W5TRX5_9NOCA|nr:MlaD family protein [Nocardia nova]AHH19971.1 Mce family protein MceE [Nocardia nova SH22a]
MTTVTRRALRRATAGLTAVTIFGVAGCGFDPGAIPVPGSGVSGPTYPIEIEFANVLNLPTRAKVVANGADIGTVTGVTVVDPDHARDGDRGHVTVDADIRSSVQLPANTVAELRQDTILGDIHIALTTPPNGFGTLLRPGGTIPIEHTKNPVQIEDAMAAVATFVQGGAVDQFQDIVNRLNAVLPDDPRETARIAGVAGADARDLADHLDRIDTFLNGLSTDMDVVHDRAPLLGELLTEPAVDQVSAAVRTFVGAIGIIGALGPVAHSLVWLTPLARSGDAAVRAFVPLLFTDRPLDLQAPSNLNALVALLRDKVIPLVEHGPKVDIRKVTVSPDASSVSTEDQVDRIVSTLRMIGMVR